MHLVQGKVKEALTLPFLADHKSFKSNLITRQRATMSKEFVMHSYPIRSDGKEWKELTPRGFEVFSNDILKVLGHNVNANVAIQLKGKYYVSRPFYKKQFEVGLGFSPYPGTLNIKLTDETDILLRKFLDRYPSVILKSGTDEGRSFGHVLFG